MDFSAPYKSVNQVRTHEENNPSSFSPCSQVIRLTVEDIPPGRYDCFNPRESVQLEIYMITLIQWYLGLVEWYKSSYLCTADTRLVESGIDSSLFTPSAMLNKSLFFDTKHYLPLQSQIHFMVHFLCSSRLCMPRRCLGTSNDLWGWKYNTRE